MTSTSDQNTRNNRVAIAYMILASALIAGTTLLAKMLGKAELGEPLHPLQISHGRFFFAWCGITSFILLTRPKFDAPHWRLHIARSASGWIGVSLMFTAVAFIPLADATAISFLNPVFAMLFAIVILGEKVGPYRWLAAGVAMLGATVLLRPGLEGFHPAAFFALISAVVMGFEISLIKRLSGLERPIQILFFNNTIGMFIATVALIFVWQAPTPSQWIALAALGLMMGTAQACFIQSVRRADSSFVVPFSFLTLVFAAGYDFAIFSAIPDQVSVTGAAIIVTGAILLAWREGRART